MSSWKHFCFHSNDKSKHLGQSTCAMGKRARAECQANDPQNDVIANEEIEGTSNVPSSSPSSSSSSSSSDSDSDQHESKDACTLPPNEDTMQVEDEADMDADSNLMAQANRAAKQSAASPWPYGPTTIEELYLWAQRNAESIFAKCENKNRWLENFSNVIEKKISHHDAYSGLGTASIACKMQLRALTFAFNQAESRTLERSNVKTQSDLTLSSCFALALQLHILVAVLVCQSPGMLNYTCVTACDSGNLQRNMLLSLSKDNDDCHFCVSARGHSYNNQFSFIFANSVSLVYMCVSVFSHSLSESQSGRSMRYIMFKVLWKTALLQKLWDTSGQFSSPFSMKWSTVCCLEHDCFVNIS